MRNRVQNEMTAEAQDKSDPWMRWNETGEGSTNNSVGGQYHAERSPVGDGRFGPRKLTLLFSFLGLFFQKLAPTDAHLLQNVGYVAARFADINLK
jgi:hypothetical protein